MYGAVALTGKAAPLDYWDLVGGVTTKYEK